MKMRTMIFQYKKPLNKSFFRHSGLDPESRKSSKPLDPPVKPGDDVFTTFVTFYKGLYRSRIKDSSIKGFRAEVRRQEPEFRIMNIELRISNGRKACSKGLN